jgi:hypothetical protein
VYLILIVSFLFAFQEDGSRQCVQAADQEKTWQSPQNSASGKRCSWFTCTCTCAKEKHPMTPCQFYPEYDVLTNLEVPDTVLTVTQEACVFNVSFPQALIKEPNLENC